MLNSKNSLLRKEEVMYRDWLISLVTKTPEEYRRYRFVLEELWKEFYTIIDDDENRVGDGLDVRLFYYNNIRGPINNLEELGRSRCLEVLIGISKRCAFEVYYLPEAKEFPDFFWELLDNLGLTEYSIDKWSGTRVFLEVDEILTRWLDRSYSYNGVGGIFPMDNVEEDQRKVPIWYQMQRYLGQKYFET